MDYNTPVVREMRDCQMYVGFMFIHFNEKSSSDRVIICSMNETTNEVDCWTVCLAGTTFMQCYICSFCVKRGL